MQIVKQDININFIGRRNIAYVLSGLMLLASLISLVIDKGPKYGIDFAGGATINVRFDKPVETDTLRSGLESAGIEKATVQQFEDAEQNEYRIQTDQEISTEGLSARLTSALTDQTGAQAEVRSIEMVGPQVGKIMQEKALMAIFFSLLFITIYISGRFEFKWVLSGVIATILMGSVYVLNVFNTPTALLIAAALVVTIVLFWFLELKYAMGAIVALIHDVGITVGLFSLFDKEFSLPIIAALLTIIGYSLNDTIIVFDRIRENLRKYHKLPTAEIINRSINETLSRTLLTSMTTLVVLISLFLLGGGIIHDFAFALIAGVLVGTYSSIFVASPILLAWQRKPAKTA